jgi:hypothetical protein
MLSKIEVMKVQTKYRNEEKVLQRSDEGLDEAKKRGKSPSTKE